MDIKKLLDAEAQEQTIDTTVSEETAKVLDALVKWSALNDSVFKLEGDEGFTLVYAPLFREIRERLEDKLMDSIC